MRFAAARENAVRFADFHVIAHARVAVRHRCTAFRTRRTRRGRDDYGVDGDTRNGRGVCERLSNGCAYATGDLRR